MKKKLRDNVGVEFKISISNKHKEDKDILSEIVLFLSYLCGVIGMIYTISFSPYLNFKNSVIYITTTFACIIIWVLYDSKKMKIIWLLFSLILLINIKSLMLQWQNIWSILSYNINKLNKFDITETVTIVSVIVAFFVYWLTFKKGKGYIIYLVSIAVIIIGPIIGNPPDILQVCLFVFFHIGVSSVGNMISYKRRKDKGITELINTAGISALFTGVFFTLSLIVAYKITDNRMEKLFSIPIRLEGEVKEITTGWNLYNINRGKVSRGNNNAVGNKKLEITVQEKPEEVIYLKNFIGNNYLDGEWEEDNNVDYSGYVASEHKDSKNKDINSLYYEDRQFNLVESVEGFENEGIYLDSSKWIKVEHITQEEVGYYIPYISKFQRVLGNQYLFSTYNEEVFLRALQKNNSDSVIWYQKMEEQYKSYVVNKYLNVSKERFPRLVKLVKENYFYDTNEITAFIKDSMREMTSYTLSPGRIPFDEEIPEYFLFESKRGYCVHYATTATLMYRMYGIPARYVTGYIVSPYRFLRDTDRTYKAVLKDKDAHAWVEIYVEGVGWQKVEVTPSITGRDEERNTNQNTVIEDDHDELYENINQEETQESVQEEVNEYKEEESQFDWGIYSDIIKVVGVVIAVISAIVGLGYSIILRRNKLLKKYKSFNADKLVVKMIEVLKFGGYIKEYTGLEAEFYKIISNIIPEVNIQVAEEIIKFALQDAFGNTTVSLEEREKVIEAYKDFCIFVYANLSIWKKFYFKYIKVYW